MLVTLKRQNGYVAIFSGYFDETFYCVELYLLFSSGVVRMPDAPSLLISLFYVYPYVLLYASAERIIDR